MSFNSTRPSQSTRKQTKAIQSVFNYVSSLSSKLQKPKRKMFDANELNMTGRTKVALPT